MIHDIQSLRAIAAFYVVFFHSADKLQFKSAFAVAGKSGVDLFFVVSGFIITYTVVVAGKIEAKSFLVRRMVRIIPLYWAVTLFYSLLLFVAPGFFKTHIFDLYHTIASLLFIPGQRMPVVYTGWTLSYEMYFYGVFATCLLLFRHKGPLCVAGFLVMSCLVRVGGVAGTAPITQFLTSELMLEFCIGIALCYFYKAGIRISLLTSVCLNIVAVGLFYKLADESRLFAYGIPWTCIFFSLVFSERQALSPKFLAYFGDASYSIYLIHVLVLPTTHYMVLMSGIDPFAQQPIFVLVYTIIGVALGGICYSFVELPLTRYLKSHLAIS